MSDHHQSLIAFGPNYFHALGGTDVQQLIHAASDEDDDAEQDEIVNARVLQEAPWMEANDAILQVACSATSTIFVTNEGRVYQSGTFHGWQYLSPTRVEIAYPAKCVEIAAGRHFCIGKLERGIGVVSWGAGHFGQLGLGPSVSRSVRPQMIPHLLPHALGTTRVQQVAAGAWHALALLDNGKVMAWGSNRKYQCGMNNSDLKAQQPPTVVYPQPMQQFHGLLQKVACGRLHSIGLEQDTGRVYTWGASHYGQCGQYSRTQCIAPPKLVEALQRVAVVDISAGDAHSLALTGGGRVFCWGSGMDGQLGLGAVIPISKPKLLADLDFVAIVAGREWKKQQQRAEGFSSCLTFGDIVESKSPTLLSTVPKIVKIQAGASYSVAISSSGHVYAWGYNDVGQLGLPKCNQDQLPLMEMTSTTMKQSSSGRVLQIRSFESRHNVLLPRRIDALADYCVTQVATGPCNMWCVATKRSPDDTNVVVGRTMWEAQEGRRRKSIVRLRKHLSGSSSISSTRSPAHGRASMSSIDELSDDVSDMMGTLYDDSSRGFDGEDSTTTLETTQASLVGAIVSPIAGEYRSPLKAPLVQEMEPLQLKEGAAPEISLPCKSPLTSEDPSTPGSDGSEKEVGIKSPPTKRDVGRSKSLSKLMRRRSKPEKKVSETEDGQMNGDQPPVSPPTSPFSCKGRSSSVPPKPRPSPPRGYTDLDDTKVSPERRLTSSLSVSRLTRGRRGQKSPKEEKQKVGRVRKALHAAFRK